MIRELRELSRLFCCLCSHNYDRQCFASPVIIIILIPCSGVLSEIDQTEFEGFEYINPLLMSKVDDV